MATFPNPQSKRRNLFLIGYRGTGKTTVGRLLAERLGWQLVDADDEIERQAGCTIAEIFAGDGERRFRDLEQQVVHQLAGRERHIVSLGGGAVLRAENREAIRGAGTVVWLTASAETIHARLAADQSTAARRPNLTSAGGLTEIEQLLAQREGLYRQCADHTLDTDELSPQQIADEILGRLGPPAADCD